MMLVVHFSLIGDGCFSRGDSFPVFKSVKSSRTSKEGEDDAAGSLAADRDVEEDNGIRHG